MLAAPEPPAAAILRRGRAARSGQARPGRTCGEMRQDAEGQRGQVVGVPPRRSTPSAPSCTIATQEAAQPHLVCLPARASMRNARPPLGSAWRGGERARCLCARRVIARRSAPALRIRAPALRAMRPPRPGPPLGAPSPPGDGRKAARQLISQSFRRHSRRNGPRAPRKLTRRVPTVKQVAKRVSGPHLQL